MMILSRPISMGLSFVVVTELNDVYTLVCSHTRLTTQRSTLTSMLADSMQRSDFFLAGSSLLPFETWVDAFVRVAKLRKPKSTS